LGITLKIQGGIGNQLYQYALMVRFKKSYPNSFVNLEFYNSDMRTPRQAISLYQLLELETYAGLVVPNLISKLYKKLRKTKLHYLAYILNERFGNVITEQQEFGFRKILLKRNLDCVVLDGYFADYRYLKDGLEEVKVAVEKLTNKIDISYDQHTAVHIRRGDYTKIMRSNEKSNVLNINYYRRCLELINNKDLVLRIYTDDYEWAKTEFPALFEGYIFDFGPEEYTDIDSLWTMAKHQYFIGANSTFSLWAYYFGMNHMKKFYFPFEWASSIQNKGYKLFSDDFNNVELIRED
jgi:hypothetical protein